MAPLRKLAFQIRKKSERWIWSIWKISLSNCGATLFGIKTTKKSISQAWGVDIDQFLLIRCQKERYEIVQKFLYKKWNNGTSKSRWVIINLNPRYRPLYKYSDYWNMIHLENLSWIDLFYDVIPSGFFWIMSWLL